MEFTEHGITSIAAWYAAETDSKRDPTTAEGRRILWKDASKWWNAWGFRADAFAARNDAAIKSAWAASTEGWNFAGIRLCTGGKSAINFNYQRNADRPEERGEDQEKHGIKAEVKARPASQKGGKIAPREVESEQSLESAAAAALLSLFGSVGGFTALPNGELTDVGAGAGVAVKGEDRDSGGAKEQEGGGDDAQSQGLEALAAASSLADLSAEAACANDGAMGAYQCLGCGRRFVSVPALSGHKSRHPCCLAASKEGNTSAAGKKGKRPVDSQSAATKKTKKSAAARSLSQLQHQEPLENAPGGDEGAAVGASDEQRAGRDADAAGNPLPCSDARESGSSSHVAESAAVASGSWLPGASAAASAASGILRSWPLQTEDTGDVKTANLVKLAPHGARDGECLGVGVLGCVRSQAQNPHPRT